jgi:RND superfamily putative drug exporter
MLDRAIHLATTRPKRVIAVWFVVAALLGLLGGLASYSVTTDDTARFLPSGSDSAQALAIARASFGAQEGTATVTGLVDRADRDRLVAFAERWRPDRDRLNTDDELDVAGRAGRIVAATPGPDAGDAALVALQWQANATDPIAQRAYRQFRDDARAAGLDAAFTGGVASLADQAEADEPRAIAQSAALVLAIVLLSALFFRGVLAAVLPLITITFVAGAAGGLVVGAALLFGFDLDVGTTQLISVVLIGVGVDYFLFLLFRVRERLRAGDDQRTAARAAATKVGPVIASAALVVIAAFATLALAEFGQFRILGPAIAISVAVMLVAGVTLMPALAAVTGPKLFWPSRAWRDEPRATRAARLGTRIAREPARAALVVGGVLLLTATIALGTKTSYDLGSGGTATAATRTADRIAQVLPEGATDPLQVYVTGDAQRVSERLRTAPGVAAVGAPQRSGDVARVDVVLDAEPTSPAAMETARGPVRDAVAGEGHVAGTAAVLADVSDSVDRDLRLVLPVAALLIGIILVATLRGIAAPLSLLAVVALEFAATLGAAVLVVQHLAGQDGVAFTLPLVVFLFVVAVGTDYNLLMVARLREERDVASAVRHVAPAIAAAGLVLASSFATLVLASDAGSREIGFALAVGILIASLLVSSVLVPALTALARRRVGA